VRAALAVGPSEDPERNIIVWMDHPALDQGARINATGHAVLKYVGGRISPEMETPRLLWLAEHRRATFDAAWQFMGLTDFLTWRASGDLSRSTCTMTCLAYAQRWSAQAAQEMRLLPGTTVATGIIDAHAGGIGTVGVDNDPFSALAYIFGTSSCTMASTRDWRGAPGALCGIRTAAASCSAAWRFSVIHARSPVLH
jgi:D-ribulokinase